MTVTEIMNIIHARKVEVDVYEELSKWMIKDRNELIDKILEDEAVLNAINKIATQSEDLIEAVDGIKAILEEESGSDKAISELGERSNRWIKH